MNDYFLRLTFRDTIKLIAYTEHAPQVEALNLRIHRKERKIFLHKESESVGEGTDRVRQNRNKHAHLRLE